MENKKILFLVPSLDMGGGERVASELSLNLASHIQRVIVLLQNKISYPYQGKLISLDTPFSKNFFLKLYNFLRVFLRFRKIVDKEKPDYVMSFGKMSHIINILTGKKPIVRTENFLSESCQGFWGRLFKIFVRFLFNKSIKIIVVSKGIENDLIKNFGIKKEKIKLIYNPIDIKKIQKMTQEQLNIEHQAIFKHPVIITTGRLSGDKGQWHLIRAFREVKNRERISDGLKLVIMGEGELRHYFERLIRDLNLEEDVYLLGWQNNPFKFLAKSKLFVSSSLWEGFGMAILEAMACGLPILSSGCKGGPREILASNMNIDREINGIEYAEYGILIPVCERNFYEASEPLTENEKILAQTIIETVNDKGLLQSLIKKSKLRANDFAVKKIIKEYESLLV